MSPVNPGASSSRPVPNVYTGLAFISMAATLGTLVYVVLKFMNMGIFS